MFITVRKTNARLRPAIRALLLTQAALCAFAQTGTPGIPEFDQFMASLMSKYGVPGGALTVTRNGRDRKSTRLNSSHQHRSRMPSSA